MKFKLKNCIVKFFLDLQKRFSIILILVLYNFLLIVKNCRYMRAYSISTNEFLMIVTFPPMAFYYMILRPSCWALRRGRYLVVYNHSRIEQTHILSILNEPFRSATGDHDHEKRVGHEDGALIWKPILIGRRLLLIVVTTLVLSPMMKLYPFGVLLVAFHIHDIVTKPYSSAKLNLLQSLSTLVLFLLLMFNIFWAHSNDVDLTENWQYFKLGKIFINAEVFLLLLPFISALCYLAYKLSRMIFTRCHRAYNSWNAIW